MNGKDRSMCKKFRQGLKREAGLPYWALPQLQEMSQTMILRVITDSTGQCRGRDRLEYGGVTTLPQLFFDHCEDFTAYELMHWWTNVDKLVKVRDHPSGSQDHQDSAAERLRTNHRRGHQDSVLVGRWQLMQLNPFLFAQKNATYANRAFL